MSNGKVYRYLKPLKDGKFFLLGTAVRNDAGWRFIPNVSGHTSSRKSHTTMERCLPRWLGHNDGGYVVEKVS